MMKSWFMPAIKAAALMLIPALAQIASADAPAANADLIKALSQYVVVLNRPIYVYNWFDASNRNELWRSELSPTDPAGFDHVATMVAKHFQALCTGDSSYDAADCTRGETNYGTNNMFGPGLYASVDPIATAGYGGSANWVLLQIRLQKGARLASLVWQAKNNTFTPAALAQFKATQCEFDTSAGISYTFQQMLAYFYRSDWDSRGEQKNCAASIRHMLKDQLKIDGIYYPYDATTFNECEATLPNARGTNIPEVGNAIRQGAFVVTSTDRMNSSDVEVFNTQTREDDAERVRISTLFYKTQNGNVTQVPPAAVATVNYYKTQPVPNFPNYKVTRWAANGCYTVNDIYACGDWFEICDMTSGNGCTYTTLALISTPVTVTTPTVDLISSSTFPTASTPAQKILWDDLEGQPQDVNASKWIKNNLLGCSDIAPYGRVPNLRYGRFFPKPTATDN